ncbi:LytR C-terminal domain-containing protein [Williamsia herbipolensis]|uniref:LytR C-terminal domain-containing protein n=1 Tax=Williamsia herbipolensis TaxID=1603258 RepID=UPI0005F77A74|nr:LytR C-terminal domain-containing protein [Williamsia herbipolensis]
MAPESDNTRLPLRAGAMLLFSIAVVCIGLGWHSAVTTTSSPEADLRAAASSASETPSSSAAVSSSAAAGAPASGTSSSTSASASSPLVCVYNAGSQSGLAVEVTDTLKAKGYRTSAPGNLQSASITENTVFYTPALRDEAEKVVADLDNGATADPRPSAFTQCRGGIAVVVITR